MASKTVVDEIQRVPTHLESVLSMLERWEARVSNELDACKVGRAPSPAVAKQLDMITKASKAIAGEYRMWVGKVKETIDNLSLEDQLRVSLNLIQSLSAGDRLKFYNHLADVELKRTDGSVNIAVTRFGK